jgi:hypothetical protein
MSIRQAGSHTIDSSAGLSKLQTPHHCSFVVFEENEQQGQVHVCAGRWEMKRTCGVVGPPTETFGLFRGLIRFFSADCKVAHASASAVSSRSRSLQEEVQGHSSSSRPPRHSLIFISSSFHRPFIIRSSSSDYPLLILSLSSHHLLSYSHHPLVILSSSCHHHENILSSSCHHPVIILSSSTHHPRIILLHSLIVLSLSSHHPLGILSVSSHHPLIILLSVTHHNTLDRSGKEC